MKNLIHKFFLIITLTALVLVALPVQSASAAPANEPSVPPAGTPDPARANQRLEWAFANQKITVERISLNLGYSDDAIMRAEELIAKAKENGKDVTAIESALAAYKAALEKGKPLYEQAKSIVAEHAGFDANGKVTNTETARQTVQKLGDVLKQYRETTGPALKALREAIKAYREANPRPQKTPKP